MNLIRRLREAPVTVALMFANLLVYAAMVATSGKLVAFDAPTLIRAGASVSGAGIALSHWRWLTAAFIHGGLLHIATNMWALAQIGAISEVALGRGLYAATYVVTGVLGNVLSSGRAAGGVVPSVSVGASGAIMGLFGMAAIYAWRRGARGAAKVLVTNILFVVVMGLVLSARGVTLFDNAAHIGGALAGAGVGLARAQRPGPMPRWVNALLIAISFAICAVAFAVVLTTDR